MQQARTDYCKRSFSFSEAVSVLWNSLPQVIRQLSERFSIGLITVFDAILNSRQDVWNYSVCMGIRCRIILTKLHF